MTVYEPLFLVLALATVLSLVWAALLAARGLTARAARIVRRLIAGAALYFAIVIIVSLAAPRRVYRAGEAQCFDDWCITVADVQRAPASTDGTDYAVLLKLSSRAKRVPMGEKGTVVYLTDGQGRRYDPQTDATVVPLGVMLQPGESVVTVRRFHVPTDASRVGLVYTHEGGFPIGWLIIGEGGWFAKPPIVQLD
jgi:hypothetical protein